MEDRGINTVLNKGKWLIVGGIIIIIILIISFTIYSQLKVKAVNNNLKEDGFKEFTKNIYTKTTTEDDKEISYTYTSDTDEFNKVITMNNETTMENTDLSYQNGKITIYYRYTNSTGCNILQEATYNHEKFNCNITKNVDSCKTKCNVLLKEAKEFKNEAEKYVKKMNSN